MSEYDVALVCLGAGGCVLCVFIYKVICCKV